MGPKYLNIGHIVEVLVVVLSEVKACHYRLNDLKISTSGKKIFVRAAVLWIVVYRYYCWVSFMAS